MQAEFCLDLADRGIGERAAIVKEHGGHGLVAAIDSLNECRCHWIGLDIDFLEGNTLAAQLGFKALAVATPNRRVHLHEGNASVHL